jgi:hypothetical protein
MPKKMTIVDEDAATAYARTFAKLACNPDSDDDVVQRLWDARPPLMSEEEVRARMVRYLLVHTDTPWSKVYSRASRILSGKEAFSVIPAARTKAAGAPPTMRRAYENWKGRLDEEEGPLPLTHRPKPKPPCPICTARRLMVRYVRDELGDDASPQAVFQRASEKFGRTHAAGSADEVRRSVEGQGCAKCRGA